MAVGNAAITVTVLMLALAVPGSSRPGGGERPCEVIEPREGGLAGSLNGGLVQPKQPDDYDIPPKALVIGRPHYPEAAYEVGIEGVVMLQLTIDARGKVADVVVIFSVPGLDAAAVNCAKGWRFRPGRKGKQPVSVVVHAPIEFRVADEQRRRECEWRRGCS